MKKAIRVTVHKMIQKILNESESAAISGKLRENGIVLDEALITFAKRAYPKEGNVVILAGGSGSGKGFVLNNLLGIEGKVFDTDALKRAYLSSLRLRASLEQEFGIDLSSFNMQDAASVDQLHRILSAKGTDKARIATFSASVAELDRKPNVIFDVTLSSLTKFHNIVKMVQEMGYEAGSIHIVWVLTEYEVAQKNNASRERRVPEIVFNDIHNGVSRTVNELIRLPSLSDYIDGDFWVVFNNREDTELVRNDDRNLPDGNDGTGKTLGNSPKGGRYVSKMDAVKFKAAGSPAVGYGEIEKILFDKINAYLPAQSQWSR